MSSNIDALTSNQQPTFDHEDDGAGVHAAYMALPLEHRLLMLLTAQHLIRQHAASTGGMH